MIDPDNSTAAGGGDATPSPQLEDTLGMHAGAAFASTRWSLVDRVRAGSDTIAQQALARVCQNYWHPLYAYVRRSGHSREQAEDLTQAFFARLLESELLADARQERGRLRTYLLTALKRFMIKEWRKETAQKRGGGVPHQSIDYEDGEQRYVELAAADASPDELFERQWAATLLARVFAELRRDYAARGLEQRFDALEEAIWWNSNDTSYARLAERLDMKENAIKQAVSRLRKQYREKLREEIRATLGIEDEAAVDDEIRCLIVSLRSN